MNDAIEATASVETAAVNARNVNGEPVIIDRQRIYPCSEGRRLLLLSDDKFKRACNRNQLRLRRKPYSFHSDPDRNDEVKSWMYGILGEDLIVVANDDRSNPEWELVPVEDTESHLSN